MRNAKTKTTRLTKDELREIARAAKDDRTLPHGIAALAEDWLRLNPEPAPLPELTSRQREIFDYFREVFATDGTSPTVREIGSHFGIRSPNGVMCHLRALTKKGILIKREGPQSSRCVRIADAYRR